MQILDQAANECPLQGSKFHSKNEANSEQSVLIYDLKEKFNNVI